MKRLINMRTIMLSIVLLVGAIPVTAVERPFALNGKGVASFIFDETGFPIAADVIASGTATHLGEWTTSGRVTFTKDEATGVVHSHPATALIASNGDRLEIVGEGTLDTNSFTDHGLFRFNGGTGRFEGASGSAPFVVAINPATGGFELTMVGTIDY